MSTDQTIEAEILAKGKTAARVTPADIEANIACEHYFTAADGVAGAFTNAQVALGRGIFPDEIGDLKAPLTLHTFCVLVLRNGFTVTGESACASPENFDAEIGRRIARENAINKIWPLMGYELRSQLARPAQPPVDNAHVAPGAEQFDIKSQTTAADPVRYAPGPAGAWPFPKSRA